MTITRATWRGRGGADVYFLDAGSMEHAEATITDAAYQPRPDIIVVIARCNRCQRKVTHGAGQLSEAHRVVGTDRVRHCQCVIPGYILRDPDVMPRRLAEIREQEAVRPPRRH